MKEVMNELGGTRRQRLSQGRWEVWKEAMNELGGSRRQRHNQGQL